MKHHFLTGLVLTILAWIAIVQFTDISGYTRTASANQTLITSSMKLPSDGLNFVAFSPDGKTLASTLFNVAKKASPQKNRARAVRPKKLK